MSFSFHVYVFPVFLSLFSEDVAWTRNGRWWEVGPLILSAMSLRFQPHIASFGPFFCKHRRRVWQTLYLHHCKITFLGIVWCMPSNREEGYIRSTNSILLVLPNVVSMSVFLIWKNQHACDTILSIANYATLTPWIVRLGLS